MTDQERIINWLKAMNQIVEDWDLSYVVSLRTWAKNEARKENENG